MYPASGLAKKQIAWATSSGRPGSRIAVRSTIRSRMLGGPVLKASVAITPGTMALLVIPWRAPSSAAERIRPSSPALVVL